MLIQRYKDGCISVRFAEALDMTKAGYKQWPKHLRPYVRKKTFRYLDSMFGNQALRIPVERLSSRKAIGELAKELFWEGEFLMFTYTRTRQTRYGCKPILKARIFITEDEDEELHARVIPKHMHRYWFWVGDKK